MTDDYRDRFYDEVELDREVKTCGSCPEFYRCPFPGCDSVGWCTRWDEWSHEDDERCDDE